MNEPHMKWAMLGAVVLGLGLLAFSLYDTYAPAAVEPSAPEPVAQDSAPLNLPVGHQCTMMLDSNAGTGYAWQVVEPAQGSAVVRVELFGAEPCDSGCCGFPVPVTLTITALKPGRETVRVIYARPWEKDKAPANQKCFAVIVQNAPSAEE